MSAREFLSITVVFLAVACLMLLVQLGADAGLSRKKVRMYFVQVLMSVIVLCTVTCYLLVACYAH